MRWIIFVLILICTPTVLAQNINISTISATYFNGEPNKDFSGSFNVKSNSTQILEVDIRSTDFSEIDILFSPGKFDLPAGGTQLVNFDIKTGPEDEKLFKGNIVALSKQGNSSKQIKVNLSLPVNFTSFTVTKVKLGSDVVTQGAILEGFFPASLVELSFDIESNYNKSKDPKIHDIDFNISLYGKKFNISRKISLDYGEKEKVKSESFRIPFDVKEGQKYHFEMNVDARDKQGRSYDYFVSANITHNKKLKDVGFSELTFSPSNLSCGQDIKFSVGVGNAGDSDISDAYFNLEGPRIGTVYSSELFPLLTYRSKREIFNITIPYNVTLGFNSIEISTGANTVPKKTEYYLYFVNNCTVLNNTIDITNNTELNGSSNNVSTGNNSQNNSSPNLNLNVQNNISLNGTQTESSNLSLKLALSKINWNSILFLILNILLILGIVHLYKKVR
jgi:hypothetical protein